MTTDKAAKEETKENLQQNVTSRLRRTSSSQKGRTAAAPARGRPTRTSSKRSVTREDDSGDDEAIHGNDDSGWELEESSVSADDEESDRLSGQTKRRTSRRLQEKKVQRDSDVSFDSTRDDEPDATATVGRRKSRTTAKESNGQSSGRHSSGTSSTRRRSTSSKVESEDDSSSCSGPTARKSAIPMHRGRRYESKIQNPGASARTGKMLSSIPSDSVAPMSPLVTLPVSRLDADIVRQQELEEKKAAAAARKSAAARPRTASMGSQSAGSDSESNSR